MWLGLGTGILLAEHFHEGIPPGPGVRRAALSVPLREGQTDPAG